MKKAEIILFAITIIALSLKFLLIPGGSFLAVISMSSLSVLYLYFSFVLLNGIPLKNIFKRTSYRGISTKRILGSIFAGMAIAITITGLLFKVQLWPGATAILWYGWLFLFIIFVVAGIKYFRTKSDFYTGVITRIAICGVLALILVL